MCKNEINEKTMTSFVQLYKLANEQYFNNVIKFKKFYQNKFEMNLIKDCDITKLIYFII